MRCQHALSTNLFILYHHYILSSIDYITLYLVLLNFFIKKYMNNYRDILNCRSYRYMYLELEFVYEIRH